MSFSNTVYRMSFLVRTELVKSKRPMVKLMGMATHRKIRTESGSGGGYTTKEVEERHERGSLNLTKRYKVRNSVVKRLYLNKYRIDLSLKKKLYELK